MGWEPKGNRGDRYYYRSLRINGRPTKRYIGRGRVAEMAARLVEQAQAARLAQREAIRAEQLQLAVADRALRELQRTLKTLVEATLIALGYYCHHRGEWRSRSGCET